MANAVKKVENLSKQYRLGNIGLDTIVGANLNRLYQPSIRSCEDLYVKIFQEKEFLS